MKLKVLLLTLGGLIMLFHSLIINVSIDFQIAFFLVGVIIFGIPHGAADVLVANTNSTFEKVSFSKLNFLVKYIVKLLAFALLVWLFPSFSLIIFTLFSAYHFGETDLYVFTGGKYANSLYFTYGLTIIGSLLLSNINEVLPLVNLIRGNSNPSTILNWFIYNKFHILFGIMATYLVTLTLFVYHNKPKFKKIFFINIIMASLVLMCSVLPLYLGFTFYFVIWHSTLSLNNILKFVSSEKSVSKISVFRNIISYTFIALIGIAIVGFNGFMFSGVQSIAVYLFMGLAVLTGPHMDVMHEMYTKMKSYQKILLGN